jgi:hypothetical protein
LCPPFRFEPEQRLKALTENKERRKEKPRKKWQGRDFRNARSCPRFFSSLILCVEMQVFRAPRRNPKKLDNQYIAAYPDSRNALKLLLLVRLYVPLPLGGKRPGADRAHDEVKRKVRKRERIPELAARTQRVPRLFYFCLANASRFLKKRSQQSRKPKETCK